MFNVHIWRHLKKVLDREELDIFDFNSLPNLKDWDSLLQEIGIAAIYDTPEVKRIIKYQLPDSGHSSTSMMYPCMDSIKKLLHHLQLQLYIEAFNEAGYDNVSQIQEMNNENDQEFIDMINTINCILK